MIELGIYGKKVLIVGLYAPNQQQEQFYKQLHQKITLLDYRSVVLMGDWNGVLDTQRDKKGSSPFFKQARLPKAFFDMKEDWELRDYWRERNQEERDFTFFSDRHQSFSRIDFFLITTDLYNNIINILFQQPKRRLYTWTSSDGQHRNQIDYVLCSQRWRSSIQSVKTRP